MSHHPGHRSLDRLRRCTSNRPSLDRTAMPTERCCRRRLRISARLTVAITRSSSSTMSTSSPITAQVYHSAMELDTLRDASHDLLDGMVTLRRTLHEWPELGND